MSELVVKSEQPSLIDVIARATADPSVDVGKMAQVVELQLKIDEEIRARVLNEALAKLAPLIAPLKKTKAGASTKAGQVKFYYTPYEQIAKMLAQPLRDCGLSLSFDTRPVGDKVFYVGRVQEVTKGGFREAMIPYAPDANDQLNGPQKVASGLSYAKRYVVSMLFNLVTESDNADDDGQFAGAISAEQVGEIERLITKCGDAFDGVGFVRFLEKSYGVSEVTKISSDKYEDVKAALLQKLATIKKTEAVLQ